MNPPILWLLVIAAILFGPLRFLAMRKPLRDRLRSVPPLAIVLAMLVPSVLSIAMFLGPDGGVVLVLAALSGLAFLWFRELLGLMAMSDDAFPGRFDKVLWFVLLVLLPPVGLAAFATFRRSFWAVEKPAPGQERTPRWRRPTPKNC
jgi:hypothetical protein